MPACKTAHLSGLVSDFATVLIELPYALTEEYRIPANSNRNCLDLAGNTG